MPSVPYIRFYTDFPRHRKTVALRRILGAYEYIVNLWAWAAENAMDGDLSTFTVEEIEFEARWTGEKGKAMSAFIQTGFIDKDGETLSLHNWMARTGQGVEQLVKYREKKKIKQREKREKMEKEQIAPDVVPGNIAGNEPGNEPGNPITLTLTLSDLSSESGSETTAKKERAEYPEEFEEVWKRYGRKEEKGEALAVWKTEAKKAGGQDKLRDLILKALEWQAPMYSADGWKFAKYFSRYLKKQKWLDEKPTQITIPIHPQRYGAQPLTLPIIGPVKHD